MPGSTTLWPMKVKSNRDITGTTESAGDVVATKSVTVGFNGSTAVDGTITLPPYSRITDIVVLITTAFNSATSNTLSIGTTSGGTQYLTSLDLKTAAGRIPLTATHVTGTQAANWLTTSTNASVVCTQTPVGSASAGSVTISVSYTVANPDNITHSLP